MVDQKSDRHQENTELQTW